MTVGGVLSGRGGVLSPAELDPSEPARAGTTEGPTHPEVGRARAVSVERVLSDLVAVLVAEPTPLLDRHVYYVEQAFLANLVGGHT